MNIIDKYKISQALKLQLQRFASSGSFTTSAYSNRSLTFNWSVAGQDVAGNYTVINWNLVGSGSYTGYVMSGNFYVEIDGVGVYSSATRIQLWQGTVVASGQRTIYHNADGGKSFGAYAQAGIYNNAVNCTGSGSWALPTIPRASQPSMSTTNFNIGGSSTIYTNRASASFTHTIVATFGSFSRTWTGVGSEVTWNTSENASSLYAQIPNDLKGTGTITCYTYNGGTHIGTKTVGFTLNVTGSTPTFTDFTYEDTNTTITNVTGDNQVLIPRYSNVKVTCSPATGVNSATIKSYKAQIGTKYVSVVSPVNEIDFGTFTTLDKLYATATDSRNLSTTVEKEPIMIDYKDIITNGMDLARENGVDETVFMSINGIITSIPVNNVDKNALLVAQFRYKKTSDDTWGSWTNVLSSISITDGEYTIDDLPIGTTFDSDSSYNVQFYVQDKLSEHTLSAILPAGIPLFSYRDKMIGVRKVPTQGALDVGGDIYQNGRQVIDYDVVDTW